MARLLRFWSNPSSTASSNASSNSPSISSSISLHVLLTTYAPFVIVLGVLLWVAYIAINPTPPNKVILAAGPEGGAYQEFAKRYRTILARHHIDLEIQTSDGSMRNLHMLNAARSEADVAFVQSGTTNDEAAERHDLVSLGSLFVEPVWIFYREAALAKVRPMRPVETVPRIPSAVDRARFVPTNHEAEAPVKSIKQLGELRGLSMNVGILGSGGPRLASELLRVNHVGKDAVTLSNLPDTPAVMKLLDGSLDAVMFVTAEQDPLVQMLLQTPGIRLFDFDQAEAYSRRFPFLKHVVLPRGIVALEKDLPHEDVQLIAPTATLVARSSTHPAIIELLVQAAAEVHGGTGWFQHAGEFPNDQYTEVPVSPVAERFYKTGPPFLQRYLPFWLANLIERMGVIIVPLIALLIPITRVLPPLYSWRVRKRVYRWYGQLRDVEAELDDDPQAALAQGDLQQADLQPADSPRRVRERDTRRAKQLARLNDIEKRVNQLVVPLSYAGELYALKLHIDRVRDKLSGTRTSLAIGPISNPKTTTGEDRDAVVVADPSPADA